MRTGFFKGVVLGAVVSSTVFVAGAAMAGTGVGAVFNIGATNTVNNPSTLQGNSAKTLQLINSGDGPALGMHVKTGQPPLSTNSRVRAENLNADMVDGVHAAGFVQGGGRMVRGRVSFSCPSGNGNVLVIPGVQSIEMSCGAGGYRLFSRNLSNPQRTFDTTWVTSGGAGHYASEPTSNSGTYLAFDVKPDDVITQQVTWPGHVVTIVTSIHWTAATTIASSQAFIQ